MNSVVKNSKTIDLLRSLPANRAQMLVSKLGTEFLIARCTSFHCTGHSQTQTHK